MKLVLFQQTDAGPQLPGLLTDRGVVDISAPVLGVEGALAVLTCPFVQRQDTEPAPGLNDVMQALRAVARDLSVS